MSRSFFIADLHLSADRPDISACLQDFLQTDAIGADALYVLGDLFESWIGDDDINAFTRDIADGFKRLSDTGVPVYFIHGNRDFLIRGDFCKRAGMKLLPEQQVIDLYGTPTLIMHGDELCTLDVNYQKFRLKSRSWWWPRMILALPLWVRRRIAANARRKSQQAQVHMAQDIMDVTPQAVSDVMQHHGVKRLIHGHTHRPNFHTVPLDDGEGQRIVLGDWYTQGSVLVATPNQLDLQSRNFKS